MDLLINPPTLENASEPTVKKYWEEVERNSNNLKEKAELIYKKLNSMKNVKCNEIEGAMYAFPLIELPEKIIKKARELKMEPDYYYCLSLLENTGLITVPGSGFGQKEGTYHVRLTNLISPKEEMIKMLDKIEQFNNFFFNQ
jgi:alanine transaminase